MGKNMLNNKSGGKKELSKSEILLISGLYPTCENPKSVPFMYNRFKELSKKNVNYQVLIVSSVYSQITKKICSLIFGKVLKDRVYSNGWKYTPVKEITLKYSLFSFILSHISERYRLYLLLKQYYDNISKNYSCIHAHWTYPEGYIATKLSKELNVPCVITAYGSDIHTNPINNNTIRKYTINALDNADQVIFFSEKLHESAKNMGYNKNNYYVIPCGIDTEYFHPMSKEEIFQNTRWTRTKKYLVGFVGNLVPIKRADKIIDIFQLIFENIIDVEFIIVGDGPLEQTLRSTSSKKNLQTTFVGRVEQKEVAAWMNEFDVMILPSRNEGWPCVILEAYGCGTPVVGSDVGGINEALGGLCPVVTDGEDFERRFADVVCSVLDKEYTIEKDKLVQRSHEFSWNKIIMDELQIYDECISNSK